MARVICIANNKGGVGKTNVAVNLPVFLAALGKKVLLVDFDHQANATISLGINPKDLPLSIYHVLMGQVGPRAIVQKTAFLRYEILPSSQDLAGAEVELVNLKDREFKLKQVLEKISKDYDFVIIDSPPSLGLLTINALCAANEVLIPVQCEYLAVEGFGQLLETVDLIRNNLEQDLKITGVLLTMYNKRNRLSREVTEEIRKKFPGYIFETKIPRSIKLAEAPKFRKTIFDYAPVSKACLAYRELAEEIIRLEKEELPNSATCFGGPQNFPPRNSD